VDPLNDAQPWEDFQRLVTYAVSIDSNLQQVKAGLGIATTKNGEKKKDSFYRSRWSKQESREIYHEVY
jgi:hypothetical protein